MKQYLSLSAFSFFLFVILSFLVSKDVFDVIDFDITVKTQDRLGDFLVGPFSLFSLFGSVEIASLILLLTLIFSKKLKSIIVLLFYVLVGFFELWGKSVIEQKGPPVLFLKTHLPFQFPSSYIPHEFFAYPSGHSARTAFVSIVLLFVIWKSSKLRKELKYAFTFLILTFDFLMFVSRVYLGEHWFSDVIGGVLLGVSLALFSAFFLSSKYRHPSDRAVWCPK